MVRDLHVHVDDTSVLFLPNTHMQLLEIDIFVQLVGWTADYYRGQYCIYGHTCTCTHVHVYDLTIYM